MFRAYRANTPFTEITPTTPLASLTKFFENHSAAVVTERVKQVRVSSGVEEVVEVMVVKHVVTKVDLVTFLVRKV